MNPALVAIVLAIGAGAVVAVSTREPAAAATGLAVALVGAALFADPLPSAAILGVRIVAALLAAALLRWAGRAAPRQASPLGWPAEALLATAGGVAGLGVAVGLAGIGAADGAPAAQGGAGVLGADGLAAITNMALLVAAGSSLLVLSTASVIHGPFGIRRAVALVLATQGVLLVRDGLAGEATDLEEVAQALLLVAVAASGAALAHAGALLGGGDRAGEEGDHTMPGPGPETPRSTRLSPPRRANPAR